MGGSTSLSEENLERLRENVDDLRDLAEDDDPVSPYAEILVSVVEEECDDI